MRGVVGFCRDRWRSLVVVLLTLATVGVAGWVYYHLYRPDQQVDAAATTAAKEAAEDGTIAVLSYSPDSLSEDIATAKSHLTGDFLAYYTHFTDQIFASAAKQQQVTTSARVVRAAVSQTRADSVVVLLFVNKESSSKANPATETNATTVQATMKRVDGSWLIAQFEPL